MKKLAINLVIEAVAFSLAFAAWFSGVLYGGLSDVTRQEYFVGGLIVLLGVLPLFFATYVIERNTKDRVWRYINGITAFILVGYAAVLVLASFDIGPWN